MGGDRRRPATDVEARALASATRLRILRLCLDRSLTNKELAQRLDAHPATVLHHVRTLVATGFLAPQETRRGARGAREVPYRSTGKSWTLDVGEEGHDRGNHAMLDAFLAELRLVEQQPGTVAFTRLGLRLTEAERDEFGARVQGLLDEYARRPPTADGRAYSVFLAVHPDLGRD